MSLPEPIDPPPPPENPPPGQLAGLGAYLRKRYTCNVAISEPVRVLDLLEDVIFKSSRMFLSQGANGKIRMHNKKPVDGAIGTAAFAIGATVLAFDNVMQWIANLKYFLLIDPHTNDSEIRTVTAANYSTSQNSVTLTTSHTGTAFTIVGFAGCNGAATPATASITVNSFVASTVYTVTLDGIGIQFTPSTGDTTSTIAGFIAGSIRGHPNLNRRFTVVWAASSSVVNLTARFGTLTVNSALTLAHVAPVASPTVVPTLTAAAGALAAGNYRVSYAYRNEHGQTLLSPYKQITLTANQKIQVTAITPPAGTTVVWYTVPEAGSTKLRYHSENSGIAFEIIALPLLSAALTPDANRTGTAAMRVAAVFSDRSVPRAGGTRSNVIRASYEWFLGNREKSINRIDLKYRDSSQDWRPVELRLRNDVHIAKIKKTLNLEVNGQAIDTGFQAYRIASSELNERRDADFFYRWSATREALLLEEGDVCAITDDSARIYNLPVMIESIRIDVDSGGMPKVNFTARKFANTYYDDSINETDIPIITEP